MSIFSVYFVLDRESLSVIVRDQNVDAVTLTFDFRARGLEVAPRSGNGFFTACFHEFNDRFHEVTQIRLPFLAGMAEKNGQKPGMKVDLVAFIEHGGKDVERFRAIRLVPLVQDGGILQQPLLPPTLVVHSRIFSFSRRVNDYSERSGFFVNLGAGLGQGEFIFQLNLMIMQGKGCSRRG